MPTLKGYLALLQHGKYLAKQLLSNAAHQFRDVSAVDEAASSFSDSETENVSHVEDSCLVVTDDSDGDDYDWLF